MMMLMCIQICNSKNGANKIEEKIEEKIETQVRNKVLADNGLTLEVDAGAPPAQTRDYSKMSSEDFKKVMDAAMNR